MCIGWVQLFYGPIEPTWFVHPQYRGAKPPNGLPNNENPYLIYSDDAFTYRRNPYMQQNAVPYTNMVAQDGNAVMRPGHVGATHPYQAQYFVHGAHPNANLSEGQNQKQAQSPARAGVLQPRNGMNVQVGIYLADSRHWCKPPVVNHRCGKTRLQRRQHATRVKMSSLNYGCCRRWPRSWIVCANRLCILWCPCVARSVKRRWRTSFWTWTVRCELGYSLISLFRIRKPSG